MSRKVRKNVGVIGLGIIGTRVAAGLRAADHQVYVWNRSAKPTPNFLGSPAEVAESAEIIQIFVADATALFDVIEAMSDVLLPKHVIVCNSTVGPEAVLEAAQMVEKRGAQFLDAPFTGSKLAAEKRQLVYYVGGSETAFQRVRPILELTSKSIVRMGEVGHASTIKVVTNMISAVTVQVLAETLSIVQKAGLEPELLLAAIEQNACRSGVIDLKLPKMMSGDYDPHFSLKHMFKDVQLGIHMANSLDIEIPATTVTAGVMYGALNQGWGDMDFSVLFKNYAPTDEYESLPAFGPLLTEPQSAMEPAVEPEAAGPLPLPHGPLAAIPAEGQAAPAQSFGSDTTPPATPASASSNGDLVQETLPTEEAARIIQAVLAHVSGQRSDSRAVPQENHGAAQNSSHPSVNEPTVLPKEPFIPGVEATPMESTRATDSQEPSHGDDFPKPAEIPASGGEEQSIGPKLQNFMRRWFVGGQS